MLVAGDLDPRQVRRLERGRVGAALDRRLDLALDGRDLGLSDGEGKVPRGQTHGLGPVVVFRSAFCLRLFRARREDADARRRDVQDVQPPVRKSNVRVSKPKTPRARTPSTLALRRGAQNSK